MNEGYLPLGLYLDAKSVFAAITATFIKPPAEKSLLCHVQYIRELLDKRVLHHLFWIDTRDMHADGLTKGAVERQLLHTLMDGWCEFKQDFEHWKLKKPLNPRDPKVLNGNPSVDVLNEDTHLCLFTLARSVKPCATSVPPIAPAPPFAAMPAPGSAGSTAVMKERRAKL